MGVLLLLHLLLSPSLGCRFLARSSQSGEYDVITRALPGGFRSLSFSGELGTQGLVRCRSSSSSSSATCCGPCDRDVRAYGNRDHPFFSMRGMLWPLALVSNVKRRGEEGEGQQQQQQQHLAALVVGLGAGTLPSLLSLLLGGKDPYSGRKLTTLDVVELDQTVIDLASECFGVSQQTIPALRVVRDDGLAFVAKEESANKYDLLFVDAYSQDAVPRGFLEPAFLQNAYRSTTGGGVFVTHLWNSFKGGRAFGRRLCETWQRVGGGGGDAWSLQLLGSTVYFAQRMLGTQHPRSGNAEERLQSAALNGKMPEAGLFEGLASSVPGLEQLLAFQEFTPVLRRIKC